MIGGLRVTSLARTLVDVAECSTREELYGYFLQCHLRGDLDLEAVEASYSRVEWRPSLPMLRSVIDEFHEIVGK